MWSAVAPGDVESSAPSARSKHSATLVGRFVYVLGGRNGNLPMKDFWKYNLATGKWQQLKPSGDKLPCLQEHSAVSHKDCIYIFGGEVGCSAGSETSLWVYDIKNNSWKKIRAQKGASTPKGRRGHTALVHRGSMLIYGGYQDLRGSCGELWAFHFETESWHLISTAPSKNSYSDTLPPPRHKHSAVLHGDVMWIYGGMTDLQERSDLWKWDTVSSTWSNIRTKQSPGPLHSHAACRLPSSMILFGGERDGHPTNDLWKFSFNTESWDKMTLGGIKPQPRSESVAFTISELLLKDSSSNSIESGSIRTRARTCNSADRGRHSSYLSNNRVTPYEKTYVFKPSQMNYIDGSELAQQYSENGNGGVQNNKSSFLQEITKLSHLNISRINNKCSYTVLTGCATESTESLLRQYASPPQGIENEIETDLSTPTRGTMVKSKSAYVIKKKDIRDTSPLSPDSTTTKDSSQRPPKRVDFDSTAKKLPREPISVPNFSLITLPTPSITPVEAARLVFLDSEDENDTDDVFLPPHDLKAINRSSSPLDCTIYENFKVVKRGESYNSHLGYADNPLYQHIVAGNYSNLPETSDENVSSTSDYASIETVNRLSSNSSYSVKTNTPQDDSGRTNTSGGTQHPQSEGPFGFCNPNYLGPDIRSLLNEEANEKKRFAKAINMPTTDNPSKRCLVREDSLELQNCNGPLNRNTKVVFHNARNMPPCSLELGRPACRAKEIKHRASSASRAEKNSIKIESNKVEPEMCGSIQDFIPLYVFVIGGKEQGQVTVFKRPLSIWKLKLF